MIKLLLPNKISKKTDTNNNKISLDQESNKYDDEVNSILSKKEKQFIICFINKD